MAKPVLLCVFHMVELGSAIWNRVVGLAEQAEPHRS